METGKKRGRVIPPGKRFSAENQPDPEAKKKGWQEWRKERHLTQTIIKEMIGEDGDVSQTFKDYVKALFKNAKAGNAKAIETINKCLEDDIMKVAQVDSEGKDVPFQLIFQPAVKKDGQ